MRTLYLVALAWAACWLFSRWLKNRFFFVERSLKDIDEYVARSILTPQQGEYYKQRIVERWLKYTRGISFQEDARQLPPKSKS